MMREPNRSEAAAAGHRSAHEEEGVACVIGDAVLGEVSGRSYAVAVLPWGATEAHNRHLPYGTDTVQAATVAAAAAREAAQRGAAVAVLPAVPFGVQTGQLDIPFCINVNPTTQLALLRDIVSSLEPHGVRFLVVLNGHGGNEFRSIIRELQAQTSIFLCSVNWWQAADARTHFDEAGDHAGELETSVMMHIAPDLVRPLESAGPGRARQFRSAAFREGWAWAPRRWIQVTEDTGVGDPRAATASKGGAFVAAATTAIGGFLAELARSDPADMYD